MKRGKILLVLLFFLVATNNAFSWAFVDIKALAQRIQIMKKHMEQWASYKEDFKKEYLKIVENVSRFRAVYHKIDSQGWGALRPTDISWILEGPYLRDREGLDPWRDLFFGLSEIEAVFNYIQDWDFLENNYFFENSEMYRAYIQEKVNHEIKTIADLRARLKTVQDMRKHQEEIMDKQDELQDQIEDFASSGDEVQVGKVMTANAELLIQLSQIEQQQSTLQRVAREQALKDTTNGINSTHRRQNFNKYEKENINKILKLFGVQRQGD